MVAYRIDVPPVAFTDLDLPPSQDTSARIALRVAAARDIQNRRFSDLPDVRVNADAEGSMLEKIAHLDGDGKALLLRAAERFNLSARGYHRVLRVARTIADLAQEPKVSKSHLAEAISYRLPDANLVAAE